MVCLISMSVATNHSVLIASPAIEATCFHQNIVDGDIPIMTGFQASNHTTINIFLFVNNQFWLKKHTHLHHICSWMAVNTTTPHPWYHLTAVAHTQNSINMWRNKAILDLVGGYKIDISVCDFWWYQAKWFHDKVWRHFTWVTFHSDVIWKFFTFSEM